MKKHLISTLGIERAMMVAKELGLQKSEWTYIPIGDELTRCQKLKGLRDYHESYIHGYFSEEEEFLLTLKKNLSY